MTEGVTESSAAPNAGGRHIVALDGLRGIAAIGVVLYHSELGSRFGVFTQGWLAVDFFLCLSGYVIGLAYDKRIVAGMAFCDFARARVIRLYPMVFVGGLLAILMTPVIPQIQFCLAGHPERRLPGIASQLTMVPMWVGPCVYAFNNVFWSLFFELVANLVHFFVLWRLSDRARLWLIAGLFCVLCGLGIRDGWINYGAFPDSFWKALPRCLFSYLIGYSLFRTRDRWAGRLPAISFATIAATLFAVLIAPPLGGKLPASGALRFIAVAEEMAILALVFPCILATGVSSGAGGRWLKALGAASYPLYAIHAPLVLALIAAVARLQPRHPAWATAGGIVAVVILAWLLAVTVDLPLNRLRSRKLAERRLAAAQL